MKYYFFAATLPTIGLETKPPLSFDDFRRQCGTWLSAPDRRAIVFIAGREPAAPPAPDTPAFLAQWRAMETQIRNAAAAARRKTASGAKTTTTRHEHNGFRVDIEKAVEAAFSSASPLERELALDRLRWRLLEELGGHDPFTSEAVLSYACRLLLSERWAGLTDDAGKESFEQTIGHIMEKNRRKTSKTKETINHERNPGENNRN